MALMTKEIWSIPNLDDRTPAVVWGVPHVTNGCTVPFFSFHLSDQFPAVGLWLHLESFVQQPNGLERSSLFRPNPTTFCYWNTLLLNTTHKLDSPSVPHSTLWFLVQLSARSYRFHGDQFDQHIPLSLFFSLLPIPNGIILPYNVTLVDFTWMKVRLLFILSWTR